MRIHKSITSSRVARAVERAFRSLDNPGFCIACGKSAHECEPDMRCGTCEHCGKPAVYGAEELLMQIR